MSKITVTMWLTLDGFASGINGELDWIIGDDEMSQYELDAVATRDTLLFGANTYKEFSSYWPTVENLETVMDWEREHGRNMTQKKKVVISKTIKSPEWENTEVISKITPESINKIKNDAKNGVLIYGSLSVVQQLANLGLIDRYELLVHPLALSKGRALFANLDHRLILNLIESRQFPTGVQLQVYEPKL